MTRLNRLQWENHALRNILSLLSKEEMAGLRERFLKGAPPPLDVTGYHACAVNRSVLVMLDSLIREREEVDC